MGLSNKYSFVPKVTSTTNQYSPNLEALTHEEDQKDLLRGSFNPDYQASGTQEMIKDNYFNKSRDIDGQEED